MSEKNPLENFRPYEEVEIFSNHIKNITYLFTFDHVAPLIIGKGNMYPSIWLSTRSEKNLQWYYAVLENESIVSDYKVSEKAKTTKITLQNFTIIEAEQISYSKVKILALDLRPLGLEIYCENDAFYIGVSKFEKATITGNKPNATLIQIESDSLNLLYSDILSRFPAGREASYLFNTKNPDIEIIRQNLNSISQGYDSDKRYRDENSKKDALEFIKRLDAITYNMSLNPELRK